MIRTLRALSLSAVAALYALTTHAQLYGNLIPPEILANTNGNIWFGAVRDQHGGFVADATVILDTGVIEYVAVTDQGGRFRLQLPKDTTTLQVSSRCSHPAYQTDRLMVRPPRRNTGSPVELSCFLK